jgi:hypothetical protein
MYHLSGGYEIGVLSRSGAIKLLGTLGCVAWGESYPARMFGYLNERFVIVCSISRCY